MKTYPNNRPIVHQESSLSAFATGLFIGTLATLLLATEDGRKAGKKLLDSLKSAGHDLAPELSDLPQKIAQTADQIQSNLNNPFEPLDRLHRSQSNSSFTQSGKPLR